MDESLSTEETKSFGVDVRVNNSKRYKKAYIAETLFLGGLDFGRVMVQRRNKKIRLRWISPCLKDEPFIEHRKTSYYYYYY